MRSKHATTLCGAYPAFVGPIGPSSGVANNVWSPGDVPSFSEGNAVGAAATMGWVFMEGLQQAEALELPVPSP